MTETEEKKMSKALKVQMILTDLKYDQIGNATGRAWAYRINNPSRMKLGDLLYLLDRLDLTLNITNK